MINAITQQYKVEVRCVSCTYKKNHFQFGDRMALDREDFGPNLYQQRQVQCPPKPTPISPFNSTKASAKYFGPVDI